jgi:two-component system, OmpR family, sensor histidine kinase KdpD
MFKQKNEKKKIVIAACILLTCTILSMSSYFVSMFESNIVMIYLLGILFISYAVENYAISFCASLLAVFLYNFFFVEPFYTLKVDNPNYLITFFVMFIAAFITSMLTIRVKLERQQVKDREENITALYQMEKRFLSAKSREDLARTASEELAWRFGANVLMKLFDSKGEAICRYVAGNDVFTGQADVYAIEETYRFGRTCGRGTSIFQGANAYYRPIKGLGDILGVIGISMVKGTELSDSQLRLLDVIIPQIEVVLQREKNYEKQQKTNIEIQKERLRADMLRSISHDFRTPLTVIMGLASTAVDNYEKMADEDRKNYLRNIQDEASWLNEIVENILQATRFEEGSVKLNLEEEAAEEIITEAVTRVKKHAGRREITVNIPEEIILIKVDGVLIRQVLINLLNNAVNYSTEGSEIVVSLRREGNRAIFEVSDNGEGIPEEDLPHIFERYQRSESSGRMNRKGIGLGLSLCKSIVEAHNGEITIRKNSPKGTVVSFYVLSEEEEN